MNRRGFTLVEFMIVAVLIGILANLAIPAVHSIRLRATAATIAADLHLIRSAVMEYSVTESDLPGTAAWGRVPDGLEAFLPTGFSFSRNDVVEYRWQRYGQGQAAKTGQTGQLWAKVTGDNREIIEALRGIYQVPGASTSGTQLRVPVE